MKKTHKPLTIERPPASAARRLDTSNPNPPPNSKRAAEALQADQFDLQALQADLARFHEEMRRRAETPFQPSWDHEG